MNINGSTEKLMLKLLSSIVPAETIQMLQPDNVRALINGIGAKLRSFEETQQKILQTQTQILERLNDNGSNGNGDGSLRLAAADGSE